MTPTEVRQLTRQVHLHHIWLLLRPVHEYLARLPDGKGRFRDSIARDMWQGYFPTGDGWDLMIKILSNNDAVEATRLDALFRKVEVAIRPHVTREIRR